MGISSRRKGLVSVVACLCLLMLLLLQEQNMNGVGVVAWGSDGHSLVCSIAQTLFTKATATAVKGLLPTVARSNGGANELASWCSWADEVKWHYPWSRPLHYIDTPDQLCNYDYQRDCNYKGTKGVCVAGAINNYTSQLTAYGSSTDSVYNLTEALLFLAHFTGDIHQPLHVGFSSDEGGNTILVHWFGKKENLHHIWDTDIIETAITSLYESNIQSFQDDISQNITETNINQWSKCNDGNIACPDEYAQESIETACDWAYKDAPSGSYLRDSYFMSRLPIVEQRLARAGVRLASILNNVFQVNAK